MNFDPFYIRMRRSIDGVLWNSHMELSVTLNQTQSNALQSYHVNYDNKCKQPAGHFLVSHRAPFQPIDQCFSLLHRITPFTLNYARQRTIQWVFSFSIVILVSYVGVASQVMSRCIRRGLLNDWIFIQWHCLVQAQWQLFESQSFTSSAFFLFLFSSNHHHRLMDKAHVKLYECILQRAFQDIPYLEFQYPLWLDMCTMSSTPLHI